MARGCVVTVYYADDQIALHHGDCLEVLATLPGNSIDAICTDPPYELGFMGKHWDGSGIAFNPDTWALCLRVLKPGGHMLAFGGTRTWHRLASAIEGAGFEIRDSIAWLYGSGFPKSLDVSKAIDKRGGNAHLATQIAEAIKAARVARGWTTGQADRYFCGGSTNWTWYEGRKGECRPPTPNDFARISSEWPELVPLAELVAEADRETIGISAHRSGIGNGVKGHYTVGGTIAEAYDITAPATDAAKHWQGWGTALKPAFEPIVVARKPIQGTVAANVLAHGTGALNIDACRVETTDSLGGGANKGMTSATRHKGFARPWMDDDAARNAAAARSRKNTARAESLGRWPPNVVLDGDMADELDKQSGYQRDGKAIMRNHRDDTGGYGGKLGCVNYDAGYGAGGGASRYFPTFRYTAKAATAERPTADGISHPTVKPLELMRWLVRLVTPPGGTVLDPFAGSGTVGEAAIHEHKHAILIEREPTYLPLIVARLSKPMAVGFDFEEPA